MKVCLVQSGGFAGAFKRCEVDTATLEQPEAEQLQRFVSDSGLNQSASAFNEDARDLNQYE
ncbi:protealysin inhibitor emfourin, partial [Pseudomonas syringae group genomosp. 7]